MTIFGMMEGALNASTRRTGTHGFVYKAGDFSNISRGSDLVCLVLLKPPPNTYHSKSEVPLPLAHKRAF